MRRVGFGVLGGVVMAGPVLADVPQVATDIAPVQSLVAMVMGDLGTPALIVPQGGSPHGHAMRPSEASALQEADLVVWIGAELTPWLEGPMESLAQGAAHLGLLDVDGVEVMPFRSGATFEAHDHDDGADDHHPAHDDDHAHDEHDHDHAQDDEHAHDDHDHAHDDHAHDGHDDHAHDHDGADPHAWLDPSNAALWLDAIAAELAALDPENAARYAANASAAQNDLAVLDAEIAGRIDALDGGAFVVFHDAYHYFEAHYGVEAAGAITLGDAAAPSPARVAEIRDLVADLGITCVFAEPQFNTGLVDSVFEGTGATIALIDPIGVDLPLGPTLYPDLLRGMADSFADCL